MAEDDVIIGMDLKTILKKDGFKNISFFNDGKDLLEQALIQPPDLIITDILLAHNTNGFESVEEIWKQYKIPILFISAFEISKYKKLFENESCRFISKPFKESEVLSMMYSLLDTNIKTLLK